MIDMTKHAYTVRPGRCGNNGCTIAHKATRRPSVWHGGADMFEARCDETYFYAAWMIDTHDMPATIPAPEGPDYACTECGTECTAEGHGGPNGACDMSDTGIHDAAVAYVIVATYFTDEIERTFYARARAARDAMNAFRTDDDIVRATCYTPEGRAIDAF